MHIARHAEAVTGHHGIRRRMLLALPTAVVAAALFGTPSLAATPAGTPVPAAAPAAAAPASQGIIMRDGGICDPIRHMGC